MDALPSRLDHRHARVLDRVRFLGSFLGIAAVLWPAVADQEEKSRMGLLLAQLRRRVANRRPHARRVKRPDTAEAFSDIERKRFFQVFDDVKLDVVPAMSGEAVNAVAVTDRLEG